MTGGVSGGAGVIAGAGGSAPQCTPGLEYCGNACTNLQSDSNNCGMCGNACPTGQVCSQRACAASCAAGEERCATGCANVLTDSTHCGFCGNICNGGQVCSGGTCNCPPGQSTVNGVCVATGGGAGGPAVGSGGSSGADPGTAGASTGGAPTTPGLVRANGCEAKPGLIADFEEGVGQPPVVIAHEGRSGGWEDFDDMSGGTLTMTVEDSGGTADCDKAALHVKGQGFTDWGAGFGFSLVGAPESPQVYPAQTHNFTGISFKAKLGSTHDAKAPLRFNISTPWTENEANPGGQCRPTDATDNMAATDCYQHVGKFLYRGTGANDIGTEWKTFSFCFDRDLFPLSLPSNLTTEQRNNIATSILKIQFQPNQGKDYSGPYPADGDYPAFGKQLPFDIWLDDISFFSGACPNATPSPSNGSPAKPFPQNTTEAKIGTCAAANNAAKFNDQIAQAYARWTANFVRDNRIIAPEQDNITTSEAMGYGMMIAAAMGDKAAFDKFHAYVNTRLDDKGLMHWSSASSQGSASDGDIDIAYALLMANVQWPSGGYATAANTFASRILMHDIQSNVVRGGSNFPQSPFNPSYFAPAAFRAFGTSFAAAITEGYRLVGLNVNDQTRGIPTDWASATDGKQSDAGGAQVTSQIQDTNGKSAMGYDAARVPWRIGLDACLNSGADKTALTTIVDFFAQKYAMGAKIDLMKAGWYKTTGMVHTNAKDLQGSYIGPMGVGGMATGNAAMRDRAFRVLLDILESGDFNHTYFPATVGLLSVLFLSGNFPTP